MIRNSLRLTFLALFLLSTCVDRVGAAEAATKTRVTDLAGMDKTVHHGDDFYRYANGSWMDATPIPPDRSSYGGFSILEEEVSKRTAALIQEAGKSKAAAGSEAAQVGTYYDAYMDEKSIERKGLAPLKPELDEIRAIADRKGLSSVLGRELRADVDALNNTNFHTDRLFGVWVAPDFANPDINVAYLMQGGLGMPDRDNYTGTGAKDAELQAKYRAHVVAVLKLAHISEADARGARIYDLEARIAQAHVSRTESVDVLKANNP